MRQARGAALLTALILVTLIATLAAALVARQQRAIALEAADRHRAQAEWILLGALDWARLILREDARANKSKEVDHLGEIWAVPLAEARLSSFLVGPDAVAGDEGLEAFMAGRIEDAQARYNLARLGGKEVDPAEAKIFLRLCQFAGLPQDLAHSLLGQLNRAVAVEAQDDGADAPVRPEFVQQLRWLGAPPAALQALQAWVVLLPDAKVPINVNTAPREVIAAVVKDLDLATAERLVQQRRAQPFGSVEEVKQALGRPGDAQLTAELINVKSEHFFVTGRLRLDSRTVEMRSLVKRTANDSVDVVWRERVPTAPGESTRPSALGAP